MYLNHQSLDGWSEVTLSSRAGNPPTYQPIEFSSKEIADRFLIELMMHGEAESKYDWEVVEL